MRPRKGTKEQFSPPGDARRKGALSLKTPTPGKIAEEILPWGLRWNKKTSGGRQEGKSKSSEIFGKKRGSGRVEKLS